MSEEIAALERTGTWDLVHLPPQDRSIYLIKQGAQPGGPCNAVIPYQEMPPFMDW